MQRSAISDVGVLSIAAQIGAEIERTSRGDHQQAPKAMRNKRAKNRSKNRTARKSRKKNQK